MTREELEEGLRLQAEAARSQSRLDADIFDEYMAKFHDELLSLAEEARWRDVTEEPPPQLLEVDAIFSRGDECSRSVRASLDSDGHWYDSIGGLRIAPTHWRPLPKGPER